MCEQSPDNHTSIFGPFEINPLCDDYLDMDELFAHPAGLSSSSSTRPLLEPYPGFNSSDVTAAAATTIAAGPSSSSTTADNNDGTLAVATTTTPTTTTPSTTFAIPTPAAADRPINWFANREIPEGSYIARGRRLGGGGARVRDLAERAERLQREWAERRAALTGGGGGGGVGGGGASNGAAAAAAAEAGSARAGQPSL